jgi:hypothetical protein
MNIPISFEDAVTKLAIEDGVGHIVTIPGVWECLSEYYNNAAIKLMEEQNEEANEEDNGEAPEILINEADYASCDDGSMIELICGDIDWCESDGGGFGWEWDESERIKGGHMATCCVDADPPPNDCTTPEAWDKHLKKVVAKTQAMLEAKGYTVGFFG